MYSKIIDVYNKYFKEKIKRLSLMAMHSHCKLLHYQLVFDSQTYNA